MKFSDIILIAVMLDLPKPKTLESKNKMLEINRVTLNQTESRLDLYEKYGAIWVRDNFSNITFLDDDSSRSIALTHQHGMIVEISMYIIIQRKNSYCLKLQQIPKVVIN